MVSSKRLQTTRSTTSTILVGLRKEEEVLGLLCAKSGVRWWRRVCRRLRCRGLQRRCRRWCGGSLLLEGLFEELGFEVRNEGEVWERRRRAGAEVVETKVEDRLICIEVVLLILVGMEILVVDTLEKREKPGVIRIVVRVVLGVDGDGRYGVVRRSALIR